MLWPCIDRSFIGGETLDTLPLPSQVGRTGGIDLNKPHMRWAAEAVLALATAPHGWAFSMCAVVPSSRRDPERRPAPNR
jgi:hypothetical protein